METMANKLFNKEAMDEVKEEGFGLFRLRLKGISTPVFIRFYRVHDSTRVHFVQSHFIKTPDLAEPHRSNDPFGSDELDAAFRARSVLMIHYLPAMKTSTPNDSWLVKNDAFMW